MRADNVVELRDNERELLDMFQMLEKYPAARPREYSNRVAEAFADYSERIVNEAYIQVGYLCGIETLDDVMSNPTTIDPANPTPADMYHSYREEFCAGYALAALLREVHGCKPGVGTDKLVRLVGVIKTQTEICRPFTDRLRGR